MACWFLRARLIVVSGLGLLVLILPGTARAGGPSVFGCPPQDNGGDSLVESSCGPPLFCSYPGLSCENPNDYYCTYDATTGNLIIDSDAGLCPGTATSGGICGTPNDCNGVCDLSDAIPSADCNGVCDVGDAPGSADCNGVCDPGDAPGSADCPNVGCGAPRSGCQSPSHGGGSTLNATAERIAWKWLGSSTPVDRSEFGDPVSGSTDYQLCVYDTSGGPPTLALAATIPGGGSCGARPCWKQSHNGFSYFNAAATPDGVGRVRLQAGAKAYIVVRGHGSNLHMPVSMDGLYLLREFPQVIAQLQRTDSPTCWETVFTSPALTSTRSVFKDRIR